MNGASGHVAAIIITAIGVIQFTFRLTARIVSTPVGCHVIISHPIRLHGNGMLATAQITIGSNGDMPEDHGVICTDVLSMVHG